MILPARTAVTRVAAALAAAAMAAGVLSPSPAAEAQAERSVVAAQVAAPVEAAIGLPAGWPDGPAASAISYLLVDAATGQVLAERDPDVRRPVASTVKVLTALVILRRHQLDEVVEIGDEVNGIGGASTGLAPGQRRSVAELLDAMVVRSGNDAAVALAVHSAGSVPAFAVVMREEAAALGLRGTTLVTPSGLDDSNQLSARDLAVITRAAMADPRFRAIAGKPSVVLAGRTEVTRNELLGAYPGANGVKTGFTEAAGYAFIGSAQRDGRELIAVVLGSRTTDGRFAEAARLLTFGFEGFTPRPFSGRNRLRRAGQWIAVRAPGPVSFAAPADGPALTFVPGLPIEIGDEPVVELDVRWEGELLGTVMLAAAPAPRREATGDAAVGRWLWDRAYEAMRARPPA